VIRRAIFLCFDLDQCRAVTLFSPFLVFSLAPPLKSPLYGLSISFTDLAHLVLTAFIARFAF